MVDIVKITPDVLDVSEVNKSVMTDSSTGATSLFIGTTRDHFEGKTVTKLEYEAFVPMAEKEMHKVCGLIRQKWNVHNIAIVHRLGEVKAQEASIIIAVTSQHRKESLEAVHFAIDELKAKVPIWKKEIYENDERSSKWKENKECKWSSDAVQINAGNDEIERRIESFISRKRDEINTSNIQEFCNRHVSDQSEFSCARTDSIVVSRNGSSSHLRKSKVVNIQGPQTKVIKEEKEQSSIPEALDQRLSLLENHLGPNKPVQKDVYQRLKALEDRVLYLEGISPEYFTNRDNPENKFKNEREFNENRSAQITQDLSDINIRIQELQSALKVKKEPTDDDDE